MTDLCTPAAAAAAHRGALHVVAGRGAAARSAFLAAYREARKYWIAGTPIPFPIGTYWLRRFASIPLAA